MQIIFHRKFSTIIPMVPLPNSILPSVRVIVIEFWAKQLNKIKKVQKYFEASNSFFFHADP